MAPGRDPRPLFPLAAFLLVAVAGCPLYHRPAPPGPDLAGEVLEIETSVRRAWSEREQTLTPAERQHLAEIARAIRVPTGRVFVSWSHHGTVSSLWAPLAEIPIPERKAAPHDAARSFLSTHRRLLGLGDVERLRPARADATGEPLRRVRFTQVAGDGRPVFASEVTVSLGRRGVRSLHAAVVPDSALQLAAPRLSPAEAAARVQGDPANATLGYFDPRLFGAPPGPVRLAWKVWVDDPAMEGWVYVDDATGERLAHTPATVGDGPREIFFCPGCGASRLPGELQFADLCRLPCDSPPRIEQCCGAELTCVDPASGPCLRSGGTLAGSSRQIRDHIAEVEAFFDAQLGATGWIGLGLSYGRVRATSDADGVFDEELMGCEAGWRRDDIPVAPAQLVFGTRRVCLDVVGHEMLHGMMNAAGGLAAMACVQAKAIEEGVGDVLGELIEKHITGVTDWNHGTGCPDERECPATRDANLRDPRSTLVPSSRGRTSACGVIPPGEPCVPLPDTWSDYRPECSGFFNATIVGKMGYLLGREPAEGAAEHGGRSVTGIGLRDATRVLHDAVARRLSGTSTLTELRMDLLLACAEVLARPAEVADCADAVEAVGLWSPDRIEPLSVDPSRAALGERAGTTYLFFQPISASDELWVRQRECRLDEPCDWGELRVFARSVGGPDVPTPYPPVTALIPGGPRGDQLWVCYATVTGFACDFLDDEGKHPGPAKLGIEIRGAIGMAELHGTIHVAFAAPDGGLRWSRYRPGDPGGFSDPVPVVTTGVESRSTVDPVMTSGPLAAGGPSRLFLAHLDDNQVYVLPLEEAAGAWGSSWRVTDRDLPVYTRERPAIALYRGRVHVALTEVRDPDTDGRPEVRQRNALWIVSKDPPFDLGRQSALVLQPGWFLPGFFFHSDSAGALHLVYQARDFRHLAHRFKRSR